MGVRHYPDGLRAELVRYLKAAAWALAVSLLIVMLRPFVLWEWSWDASQWSPLFRFSLLVIAVGAAAISLELTAPLDDERGMP